jgi:hypothetical protein
LGLPGAIAGLPGRSAQREGWHVCCISPFMTNFFVYMIGVILVVGALAYGASLLGLGSTWIAVIAIAALGLGVMGAIVKTRQKEPS